MHWRQIQPTSGGSKWVFHPRPRILRGIVLWVGCLPLALRAADLSPAAPSRLMELFWALLLLVLLLVVGVVWFSVVRHQVRQESGAVARRQAALEAWYRDLFDNAHDIILGLDFEGRVLSLNRAGETVLGLPRDQARGLALPERIPPGERAVLLDALRRLRGGEDGAHCEFEMTTRPEHRVVLRMNLRRQDIPGQSSQVQGIAWDVTERRRAEEALRESEQRLRHSLEERVRIGRDLHDGIIQSIYGVGLSLREGQRLLREDPTAAGDRLQRIIDDLNGIIREVRGFIEGLEPDALKGSEIRTALEKLGHRLGAASHIQLQLDIDSGAANRLTAQQAADLLQVAREALSNAIRHSGAPQIAVRLGATPGGVALEIRDTGCGFDPAALRSTGLGLRNLEARARDLGGRAIVDSAPGRGTCVRVELPVVLDGRG